MAIRGSRNGVFPANAIAIIIWLDRGLEFLELQQEEQGESTDTGRTRR